MKLNTIRFKIGILYTTILGIIIIIYTSILYITLSYNLYNDFDKRLMDKVEKIENTINSYLTILGDGEQTLILSFKKALNIPVQYPEQNEIEELDNLWLKIFHSSKLMDDFINIIDINGKSIVRSPNLNEALLSSFFFDINALLEEKTIIENIQYRNLSLRLISMPLALEKDRKYIIQIASSLEPVMDFMMTRLYYRLIPIPIFLLCGYFIGLVFVVRILRPVAEITATAEKITHKDLSKRVKTKNIDAEMRSLVDSFNNMIARLEKSFNYIGEFSSHVSHELKTPLAIIRGEIELALRKKQTGREYKRILDLSLEEIGRMLRIIDDLLLLTKLDYRPDFLVFKMFDLLDFIKELCEQCKLLAASKEIAVDIDIPKNPLRISADKIHLRRLFFNLIDNAIKFTPCRGRINFSVKREHKKVLISISDTGIGIKKENLVRIFDKFFCGDNKAKNSSYGSGLGLSIVQSIARIHKGNIHVRSRPGKGTTFTVVFPAT